MEEDLVPRSIISFHGYAEPNSLHWAWLYMHHWLHLFVRRQKLFLHVTVGHQPTGWPCVRKGSTIFGSKNGQGLDMARLAPSLVVCLRNPHPQYKCLRFFWNQRIRWELLGLRSWLFRWLAGSSPRDCNRIFSKFQHTLYMWWWMMIYDFTSL